MFYFVLRQPPDIAFCLADSGINRILVTAGGKFFAGLFAFEDEAVTPIQIYVPFFRGRVSTLGGDESFKDISVLPGVAISWVRAREAQQIAQVPHERLKV
jgi:hypothetical protein